MFGIYIVIWFASMIVGCVTWMLIDFWWNPFITIFKLGSDFPKDSSPRIRFYAGVFSVGLAIALAPFALFGLGFMKLRAFEEKMVRNIEKKKK